MVVLRVLHGLGALHAAAQVPTRHDDAVALRGHADGALLIFVICTGTLDWVVTFLIAATLRQAENAFDLKGHAVDYYDLLYVLCLLR